MCLAVYVYRRIHCDTILRAGILYGHLRCNQELTNSQQKVKTNVTTSSPWALTLSWHLEGFYGNCPEKNVLGMWERGLCPGKIFHGNEYLVMGRVDFTREMFSCNVRRVFRVLCVSRSPRMITSLYVQRLWPG